jgi:hypothetical protein
MEFSNHEIASIWLFRARCFERELKPQREYVCSIWRVRAGEARIITAKAILENFPSFTQFSHGRHAWRGG